MGTTCCCLGTASVYFSLLLRWTTFSYYAAEFSLWCYVHSTYSILGRWEAQVLNGVKLTRRCCVVYSMADSVFQELRPAAGCQTYIHFCPVSQAISFPYVTVNAYRDTAPCLRLQICAVEEEEAICLLVMCSKLGSYFTPAGIDSHFPPSGQLLRCSVGDVCSANSLKCLPPVFSFHCILMKPPYQAVLIHCS